MKLTQTDAVFSRTIMVLFLCRNKSSWNGTKLCEDFLSIKRISRAKSHLRGHLGGHKPPGRACPPGAPGELFPHGGPADPETNAVKSYFWRKNQGERIIMFHETEPPPLVLHQEARSGVRLGLRRGGSSFFVITNPSPSPIP